LAIACVFTDNFFYLGVPARFVPHTLEAHSPSGFPFNLFVSAEPTQKGFSLNPSRGGLENCYFPTGRVRDCSAKPGAAG
jgi:hypothetical protein